MPQWNNFWTTTSATTTQTVIWNNWNTEYVETAEQVAARVARDAEHRQRILEQAARARQAEEKALALLLSILTVRQRREWSRFQRVTVKAPSGRVFRVQLGSVGNISIMDGDVRRATLCVHPRGNIPLIDVVVGQILAIQYDEERIIAMANLHGGDWSEDEREIRAGRQDALHLAA